MNTPEVSGMPEHWPKHHRRGETRAEVHGLPPCINCGRDIGPAEPFDHRIDERGQVQVRHALRFYFDECAAAVPKILANMGFCVAPRLPEGTPDIEWLTQAGIEGWIVVTQDKDVFEKKDINQALIDNKVRCFVLPGRPKSGWDQIRAFVTMWDKIRMESIFAGPFIWRYNDESQPTRWEQLYPEAMCFAPYDLSEVPVGHLLNLFADIVTQHDQGWFSAAFVDGLHHNIRREIEARIQRDRSIAMVPDEEQMERILNQHIDTKGGESLPLQLEQPVSLAEKGILVVDMRPAGGGRYLWLIPAYKAAYNVLPSDADQFSEGSFAFEARPAGFCRSGFGLRLQGL